MDSEQTWAERFDRVATENAALMVALQTRSEELRKVAMEKMSKCQVKEDGCLTEFGIWFLHQFWLLMLMEFG